MISVLFFSFLCLAVILLVIYLKNINKLVKFASQNNLKVFGKTYADINSLYADFSFLSELFSGEKIYVCENERIKEHLKYLRLLLMLQMGLGGVIFILVLAGSVL